MPIAATLLPNTVIIRSLGLRNTRWSVLLPMMTVNIPLAVIILKNFIDTIPNEFLEAAKIDGQKPLGVFFSIIIPLSRAGIINTIIVMFLLTWNDYLIPQFFATVPQHFPLTLVPGYFVQAYSQGEVGPQFAAIITIALPTMILYAAIRAKIVDGLASAGIKA